LRTLKLVPRFEVLHLIASKSPSLLFERRLAHGICPTFKGQDIQTVVNPNLFHNSKAATETENFWKLSW
jgi:hypothetical protein